MKERGQVFTLDMLFALILVTLAIGCSGQALEQVTRRSGDYAARYSLERIANDAADALVKTLGRPYNWEENIEWLETPGLAEITDEGKSVQNTLHARKLAQLMHLCRSANWDPAKSEVQAVMKLFGGSQNFELRVIGTWALMDQTRVDIEREGTVGGREYELEIEGRGGAGREATVEVEIEVGDVGEEEVEETGRNFEIAVAVDGVWVWVTVRDGLIDVVYSIMIWNIWPGWDVEASSGSENSFEVAVARCLAAARYGELRQQSPLIIRYAGQPKESSHTVEFEIYPDELEAYDWYIVVRAGTDENRIESAKIWVNRPATGSYDYHFRGAVDAPERVFPEEHGGVEADTRVQVQPPLVEGSNYLSVVVTSGPGGWVQIFVVAVPACLDYEDVPLALYKLPVTFELRLWR